MDNFYLEAMLYILFGLAIGATCELIAVVGG